MFAVIVLGLSIHASQWQNIGSVPATTSYSAFAGGFAVFVSLVGIVAIWMSAIPSLIMSVIDALASVLLLAGGVVSFRPTNSFASTPANVNLRHSPSSSRVSTVAPTRIRTTTPTRTSSSTVVALILKANLDQAARLDLVWKSCPADAKRSRLTLHSSSLHASLASLLRCFVGWLTGVVARARAQLSELLIWTDGNIWHVAVAQFMRRRGFDAAIRDGVHNVQKRLACMAIRAHHTYIPNHATLHIPRSQMNPASLSIAWAAISYIDLVSSVVDISGKPTVVSIISW